MIDDIRFYNSFDFKTFSFKRFLHNNAERGIECNFIAKMRRGTGRVITVSGEEINIESGDIFYLPKGLRYHSYWTPDTEGVVEWDSYKFDHFPFAGGSVYPMQIIEPTKEALFCLDRISERKNERLRSVGYLYAFLGEVMSNMQRRDADKKKALFSLAKDYIYKNPDFTVAELSRFLGMSESGVYSFFSSYAGTTPIKEKQRMLSRRAVSLLSTTDLSLEEIAEHLRVGSVAYLRKIIKENEGLSPSEIRKKDEGRIIP